MERTRILGGLLAASITLVGAVLLCLPASARQTPGEPPVAPTPSDLLFDSAPGNLSKPAKAESYAPIRKPDLVPTWNGGPPPNQSPATSTPGAMVCTCVPAAGGETASAEKIPKDATVDELIARLAELKVKEAELTELLRAKLLMQRQRLRKLEKLGVAVDEGAPVRGAPAPSTAPPMPWSPS